MSAKRIPPPQRKRFLPASRLIAIICISLPLFLLGLVGLLEITKAHLEQQLREGMTITMLLESKCTAEEAQEIMNQIEQLDYVKEAQYISPEEAAEQLKAEINEDPIAVLGFNPLQASIEIHLKSQYVATPLLPDIERQLAKIGNVHSTSFRRDMLEMLETNMQRLSVALLVLAAIFLVIAVIQVNSMTHIMIYSKRFLIRSMILLGAKPRMVRRPFLIYSLLNGLWGGAIASILLIGGLYYLWCETHGLLLEYINYHEISMLLGVILLIGMMLSWVTAMVSSTKYIRMDGDRMIMI